METDVMIGLYIVAHIISSIVIGCFGINRECYFSGAFFASFLLTPIIGMLVVILSERKSDIILKAKLSRMAEMAVMRDAGELLSDGVISKAEYDKIRGEMNKRID